MKRTLIFGSVIFFLIFTIGCYAKDNGDKDDSANEKCNFYWEINIQINTTNDNYWNMILPIPIISSNQGIIEHENEPIELLTDLVVIAGNCDFYLNKVNDTFFGLSIISNQNVTLFCNKSSKCNLGVGLNDFSRLSSNIIFINTSDTIILINYYTCFIYPNIEEGYWLLNDYQLKPGWQMVEFNREGSVIID